MLEEPSEIRKSPCTQDLERWSSTANAQHFDVMNVINIWSDACNGSKCPQGLTVDGSFEGGRGNICASVDEEFRVNERNSKIMTSFDFKPRIAQDVSRQFSTCIC